MARVFGMPAGLIMRVDLPQIEVLGSIATDGNPYPKGQRTDLNTGLYCEAVMKERGPLLILDALKVPEHHPSIKFGMTFYFARIRRSILEDIKSGAQNR